MSKLIYSIAATLDGFIAWEDGRFDGFLMQGPHADEFMASFAQYGTVLMGRKTYEVGLKMGVTSPYPMMRQVVFSQSLGESPDEVVELVAEDVVGFVTALKKTAEKPIWLCGGGQLASLLLASGLVDELHIKLNPILFGNGTPLVANLPKMASLSLIESKPYENGVVLLRYGAS